MKKRFLSMTLALVMMLSLLPTAAFASGTTPFSDVKAGDWFCDEVLYVKDNGLMNGTSASAFNPGGNTTRGMIVTILHRLAGQPAAAASTFQDVADDQYYADAVDWAAANGVVTGYTAAAFGPNDFITREQLAAIFYRYASLMGYDVSVGEDTNILSWPDALSVSPYAVSAMQWAVGAGLVNGSDGKLAPQGLATRAQVAAILYRFCTQVVKDAAPVTHTVTLILNDGTSAVYKTITAEDGKTITAPRNPARSGYHFGGWFTSAEGGKLFDFSAGITGDVTLYAHWSKVVTHKHSYSIVNNQNGTHSKVCRCDRTITEACDNNGENGACSVCGNTIAYVSSAEDLAAALAAGGDVKLTQDITLTQPLVISKDTVLDLNGKTITGGESVLPMIRIQDGATATVKNGSITNDSYVFIVGASDGSSSGNLIIESGTYHGATSVASVTKGTLTINGGTFSADPYGTDNYNFLLNCIDANYKNGTAKIQVKGGTFANFNPANNASEGANTNLVAPGYLSEGSDGTWTVRAVDKNNVTSPEELAAALAAGGDIKLTQDITLTQPLAVSEDTTLDLNGKTIHNTTDIWNEETDSYALITVTAGTLTVTGGTLSPKENDCYPFHVNGGDLIIEDGTFVGNISAVYVTKGSATINGGSFSLLQKADSLGSDTSRYTLNCLDANYLNGSAKIAVTGGTFANFNPANNASEGAGTDYVPDGYASLSSGDSWVVTENSSAGYAADSAEELSAAAAQAGAAVTMTESVAAGEKISLNGGSLNGGNKTLTFDAQSSDATTINVGISAKDGADVSNLKIVDKTNVKTSGGETKALRAIYLEGTGEFVVSNVNIVSNGYALNTGSITGESKLTVTNSTLAGWTSFAGVNPATFTNCKFTNEGQTYQYIRTYVAVTFDGCTFAPGYTLDFADGKEGKITLTNCYAGDTLLTVDNAQELLNMDDDTFAKVNFSNP